jgi:hypothetical protein
MSIIGAASGGIDVSMVATAGTATMVSTDNMVKLTSAFATTAAMLTAIIDGGTQEINLAGTGVTSQQLLIVWSDGEDSYISTMMLGGTGASAKVLTSIGSGGNVFTTLAQLEGVTPGALLAVNFDFTN